MGEQIPLYRKIKQELQTKIESGEYGPNSLLPTELELAEQYSVSRITSKRALEELEREGYILRKRGVGSCVIPQQARQNAAGDPRIVAMVFPYKAVEGWLMDYVRGASDFLESRRYYLSIRCSDTKPDRVVLRELVREPVSGIIYLPGSTIENEEILTGILYGGMPIVTIDSHYDGLDISSVTSDNHDGIHQVMKHLISLGHRSIGFFSSEPISRVTTVRDRYVSYCRSLVERKIPVRDDLVSCFDYEEYRNGGLDANHLELAAEKLKLLLDAGATAIVVENDITALYLYLAAGNMGVSVPERLSITGFDDLPLLRQFDVNLTTVKQDFYRIGQKAAEVLFDRITGRNTKCVRERMPVELLVRSTTGPVGRQD